MKKETTKNYLPLLREALVFLVELDKHIEYNEEEYYSSSQLICDLGDFYKKLEKDKKINTYLKKII